MRWVGVVVLIAGILGLIEGYIHIRIKDGVQKELTASLIKSQNDAIEAKAILTEQYIKEAPKQKEKIITKYKVIQSPKDTGCEAKLEEIKNAIDLYYELDTTP